MATGCFACLGRLSLINALEAGGKVRSHPTDIVVLGHRRLDCLAEGDLSVGEGKMATSIRRLAAPDQENPPSFAPKPAEFRVDPSTGLVRDGRGVSVFDNPDSVRNKGFVPYEVNQATIPKELRIIQRGIDPHHFEIVPRSGANLTPEQFSACLSRIECC